METVVVLFFSTKRKQNLTRNSLFSVHTLPHRAIQVQYWSFHVEDQFEWFVLYLVVGCFYKIGMTTIANNIP